MAEFREYIATFITDPYMLDIVCGTVFTCLTSACIFLFTRFIHFND